MSDTDSFTSSEESAEERNYSHHQVDYSTTERFRDDIPCPPSHPLPHDACFDKDGHPDVLVIKDWLKQEGKLLKEDIVTIVQRTTLILKDEPNMIQLSAPVTVCGDIHGQYYDLLKLLEIGGDPKNTTYLFLGDYVDRGSFSMECVLLLYVLKITYPTTFYLLRGNHECRHLTNYFTFKEEVEHKYDLEVYDIIMDSFDCLPIAAMINDQFLCVHGGLSPDIETLEDIQNINRFTEPPPMGPLCDILWSDPIESYDECEVDEKFVVNQQRGCSYSYTYAGVVEFLHNNNILSIIRAHEAQDLGYRMFKKTPKGYPSVITLFSAPNYLDAYGNKGAILRYENGVLNIKRFSHSPHPYWLPSFVNVFEWSLPFVSEKVGVILKSFLKCVDSKEDEDEEMKEEISLIDEQKRKEAIESRIQSISTFVQLFSKVRRYRKQSTQLGALAPSGMDVPELFNDLLIRYNSEPILQRSRFNDIRKIDLVNEKRPPMSSDLAPKSYSFPSILLRTRKKDDISD